MKTAVFVACLLCTTAALGQSIGGSLGSPVMSRPYDMTTHEQQATFRPMASEHSLIDGASTITVASGEIPLAEVPLPPRPEIPLGDVARALRKQHETAKKAQFVFEQQGK
ncbi:MAG TPA: hypothetical protein VEI49_12835 [Terriglobales bacterium]|nr:hypothetical protein [Terriglobales bacterium]HXY13986.1 hypothetical protein [Terriglobales bacterium]